MRPTDVVPILSVPVRPRMMRFERAPGSEGDGVTIVATVEFLSVETPEATVVLRLSTTDGELVGRFDLRAEYTVAVYRRAVDA